jgi:uncharacterized membrane protein (DUF485 family)
VGDDKGFSPPDNTRVGLILFAIYLTLYGGFMLVNAFAPSWMELHFLAGVNLAISYGMVLIVAALIMALVYAWLCRKTPPDRTSH